MKAAIFWDVTPHRLPNVSAFKRTLMPLSSGYVNEPCMKKQPMIKEREDKNPTQQRTK
jgi:hypothetical protein